MSRTSEVVNDITRQASFESPARLPGLCGCNSLSEALGFKWFLLPGFGGSAWLPGTGFHRSWLLRFRKIFGFDLLPTLAVLFFAWVLIDYVLKNTTFGFYLGF